MLSLGHFIHSSLNTLCMNGLNSRDALQTMGPSEIPLCSKSRITFAWEINPVQRAGGGTTNHFGCLVNTCCARLQELVRGWKSSIFLFTLLMLVAKVCLIWADLILVWDRCPHLSQSSNTNNHSTPRRLMVREISLISHQK
eukprot:SAG11_NODE_10392_length_835_cov_0.921196_2_plen_141_part_00